MTRKWFFEFLTPKNYPMAFKNHRNVFYSSQGTRWTLKFCSSSISSKVIVDHDFRHFSALDLTSEVTGWPRTSSLYINLFVSRRATRSFFPRSSSSIRGETARGGGRTNPYPLVPWKDAKWPVPARVKLWPERSNIDSRLQAIRLPHRPSFRFFGNMRVLILKFWIDLSWNAHMV